MDVVLTGGFVALIDDQDAHLVSPLKWRVLHGRNTSYAISHSAERFIYMHRLILGAKRGEAVDHRNHDGLDNRRANLRIANPSENGANQALSKANTSGFKGVVWDCYTNRWKAQINTQGRHFNLGRFDTPEEAARAYDAAALEAFGEFARTNF